MKMRDDNENITLNRRLSGRQEVIATGVSTPGTRRTRRTRRMEEVSQSSTLTSFLLEH